MANMGYCRFQNTLTDLEDCFNHIEDTNLSKEEVKAREKLIRLSADIAEYLDSVLDFDEMDHLGEQNEPI